LVLNFSFYIAFRKHNSRMAQPSPWVMGLVSW